MTELKIIATILVTLALSSLLSALLPELLSTFATGMVAILGSLVIVGLSYEGNQHHD